MARADMQTVRTTAYTHTESDHLTYGAKNALGGTLRTAIAQNEMLSWPTELEDFDLDADDNISMGAMSREKRSKGAKQQGKNKKPATTAKAAKNTKAAKNAKAGKKEKSAKLAKAGKKGKGGRKIAKYIKPQPRIGSAAADWSRWPVGTTFKVLSTGQVYRIDDYGWALAGKNTIDLYMGSKADMNRWGVRHEQIKV
jgi:3D (Asp-Asp-Asp) domain-containing protein